MLLNIELNITFGFFLLIMMKMKKKNYGCNGLQCFMMMIMMIHHFRLVFMSFSFIHSLSFCTNRKYLGKNTHTHRHLFDQLINVIIQKREKEKYNPNIKHQNNQC